jgi:hypothetical protein
MRTSTLHAKINLLPQERLAELSTFVDFLLSRERLTQQTAEPRRKPVFGSAKGTFKMAADFDAPLDDFSDYMP